MLSQLIAVVSLDDINIPLIQMFFVFAAVPFHAGPHSEIFAMKKTCSLSDVMTNRFLLSLVITKFCHFHIFRKRFSTFSCYLLKNIYTPWHCRCFHNENVSCVFLHLIKQWICNTDLYIQSICFSTRQLLWKRSDIL